MDPTITIEAPVAIAVAVCLTLAYITKRITEMRKRPHRDDDADV